jgi:hypothetical protein
MVLSTSGKTANHDHSRMSRQEAVAKIPFAHRSQVKQYCRLRSDSSLMATPSPEVEITSRQTANHDHSRMSRQEAVAKIMPRCLSSAFKPSRLMLTAPCSATMDLPNRPFAHRSQVKQYCRLRSDSSLNHDHSRMSRQEAVAKIMPRCLSSAFKPSRLMCYRHRDLRFSHSLTAPCSATMDLPNRPFAHRSQVKQYHSRMSRQEAVAKIMPRCLSSAFKPSRLMCYRPCTM